MPFTRVRPTHWLALAPFTVALVALALAVATSPAGAANHSSEQRLVVRGDATAVEGPCDANGCPLELADGRFRGTVGTGGYTGSVELKVARAFPNGEGGICAPLKGRLVLGVGTPHRLALAVSGDSCQDGGGPITAASSFTGLARYIVKYGTGRYAGATGTGLASLSEDAANQHHMTLIGRIAR